MAPSVSASSNAGQFSNLIKGKLSEQWSTDDEESICRLINRIGESFLDGVFNRAASQHQMNALNWVQQHPKVIEHALHDTIVTKREPSLILSRLDRKFLVERGVRLPTRLPTLVKLCQNIILGILMQPTHSQSNPLIPFGSHSVESRTRAHTC
jgi:hypothetical protein